MTRKDKELESQLRFCARFLRDNGVSNGALFDRELSSLGRFEDEKLWRLAERTPDDYFNELADGLYDLWPKGMKDGKWPWKESKKATAERLKALWDIRQLPEYPIKTCLKVARAYLSQFSGNTKYMLLLKYFILKQKQVMTMPNGRIQYSNVSMFADMLENSSTTAVDEWEELESGIGSGDRII